MGVYYYANNKNYHYYYHMFLVRYKMQHLLLSALMCCGWNYVQQNKTK